MAALDIGLISDRQAYADLSLVIATYGLQLRGGFHPNADEHLPSDVGTVRTVLLIGNLGSAMWQQFSASEEYRDAKPNPLDRWTRRVLSKVATTLLAKVVFPFGGPPYYPFQRWAIRADTVFASPIGFLIHPQFGLWHAYRGALLLPSVLSLPPRQDTVSPCLSCELKPCLQRCPVGAFSNTGYNAAACRSYLHQPLGKDCIQHACIARRACPIGYQYRQPSPQAILHMRAFRDAN